MSPIPADSFEEERRLASRGFLRLAGIDEAGRGPLAGPVVAAAVILPTPWYARGLPAGLKGLTDSKKLSARSREALFACLEAAPEVECGVAVIEAEEIDRINILRATHKAMAQALGGLFPPPDHLLVDGLPVRSLPGTQTALVKGDSRSWSIAAASIVAKVTRDRLMVALDMQYPDYGFAAHKGYGTARHLAALRRLGPCPVHRRSFAPLRQDQAELF